MEVLCKESSFTAICEKSETSSKEDEIIVCANCNYHITEPSTQIAMNGSLNHIFANPYGYVFEIGCFSSAVGCRTLSMPPSHEFSWFPGYSWQICFCDYCSNHLGWVFSSETKKFYGLILEKLIFP